MANSELLRVRQQLAEAKQKYNVGFARQSKATLMGARLARNQWLLPIIVGLVIFLVLIGPALSIILQILASMNPLIWVGLIIIITWLWRRYV